VWGRDNQSLIHRHKRILAKSDNQVGLVKKELKDKKRFLLN